MNYLYICCLSYLILLTKPILSFESVETQVRPQSLQNDSQIEVRYSPNKIEFSMINFTNINYEVNLRKDAIDPQYLAKGTAVILEFQLITLRPQFSIVEFKDIDSTMTSSFVKTVQVPMNQFRDNNFLFNGSLALKGTYIGHATIHTKSTLMIDENNATKNISLVEVSNKLDITIVPDKGLLDKVFMYSVIVFITISYINLGAQIDGENVRRLIESPKIIFMGFLIGITVMPSISYVSGSIFFKDQPMYRIGSFIYACGPAASASVLWTVMFDSDKELSLGLQIASTVGALFTMPTLLYTMDRSMELEKKYTIKVPYMTLGRTLVMCLIALIIGSRFVGSNARAKKISQRIFRPLTMFVLLFIITFSSYVYWYIYKMFDWNITIMALLVTSATYIISGALGYALHRDIDHMITISISSTYRNSWIAFAALVVAFPPPDTFIAYVPCLTQVVTTSLIGLVLYAIKLFKDYFHRQ